MGIREQWEKCGYITAIITQSTVATKSLKIEKTSL